MSASFRSLGVCLALVFTADLPGHALQPPPAPRPAPGQRSARLAAAGAQALAAPLPRSAAAILVRFNDTLESAGEALFRGGRPFASATADRSESIDRLLAAYGVRDVRPVFREVGAMGAMGAMAATGAVGGPASGGSAASSSGAVPRAAAIPSPVPLPIASVGELRRQQQRWLEQVRGRLAARARRADPAVALPDLYHVYRLDLAPGADAEAAAAAFARDPHVAYAEPDFVRQVASPPNDTYLDPNQTGDFQKGSLNDFYADTWGLQRVAWQPVWEQRYQIWPRAGGRGGRGEVVALIDTGLDYNHGDIAANVWRDAQGHPGRNVVDVDLTPFLNDGYTADPAENYNHPDDNPFDVFGHGTHVAGIVGAVANNSRDIAGLAWNARVMPVKAGFSLFDKLKNRVALLIDDNIATAVRWAADHGATVVNMSFGAPNDNSKTVALALAYAHGLGVVLVAAAGNGDADAANFYPCANPSVICVGATLMNDRKAVFSNWGDRVDLTAPGVDILSLRATGTSLTIFFVGADLIRASGTSMAAPHVAAAAALVLSAYPALTPEQVAARLIAGADPAPELTERDGVRWRSGRLNVLGALRALAPVTAPVIALKAYRVVSGPDGGGALQPGQTAQIELTLENVGEVARRFPVRLRVADGAEAYATVLSGGELRGRWPVAGERTLVAEVRVGDAVPWGFAGAFRLVVGGGDTVVEQPLPIVLHGPSLHRGWPLAGSEVHASTDAAPALGDLFGDGRLETAVVTVGGDILALAPDSSMLPGWPVRTGVFDPQAAPLLADLLRDGHREIVAAAGQQLHVLDAAGRELPGWPQALGDQADLAPAVGDVTGSGVPDIVAVTIHGTVKVFAPDGTILPGWPKQLAQRGTDPTLVDLEGTGALDIVVGDASGLHVFRGNGEPLPGAWPVEIDGRTPWPVVAADLDGSGRKQLLAVVSGGLVKIDRLGAVTRLGGTRLPGSFFLQLALGDVTGQGRPAIVVGSSDLVTDIGYVSALDAQGHMLPGWPVITPWDMSAPALVDLFGDGTLQVLAADVTGLYLFRQDGTPVDGWPIDLKGVPAALVAADLDGGGTLTIVEGRFNLLGDAAKSTAYAFDFGASRAAWPMLRHDPARSGVFKEP
ncbi:MAG TPA: S8 family serine peptidase [Thermoanaerobaculia bacterium]|nr:S8 family serine peptidase [Thermoanaerobaculia bacterium]